jgi:hypothetical protein
MKSVLIAAATALLLAGPVSAFAGEAEGGHIARPVFSYSTASSNGSAAEPSFAGEQIRVSSALPQTDRGSEAEPVFASVPAQASVTIASIGGHATAD